jgi:hypothetical protein
MGYEKTFYGVRDTILWGVRKIEKIYYIMINTE